MTTNAKGTASMTNLDEVTACVMVLSVTSG